jgi:hypothetical protein
MGGFGQRRFIQAAILNREGKGSRRVCPTSNPMFIPQILSLANISIDSRHIATVGFIIG